MLNVVPLLSTILPVIAASLVIAVVSINCYFKIRRKFPVSVNCWFCNTWIRIPYDDRDGFDCPHCLQYNGFTKDGDYNKVIPEQHDELMNKSTRVKASVKSVPSNGLCALCNNNQQLKVFQLANFIPLNEEHYDKEIEHFEEMLENAYKLCKKCDRVLKKTIQKQNAWMFGNHIRKVCNGGLASIQKVTEQVKVGKCTILWKLNVGLSLTLTMSVIFTIAAGKRYFSDFLEIYIPSAYTPLYKDLVKGATSSKMLHLSRWLPFLPRHLRIYPFLIVCFTGLSQKLVEIVFDRNATAKKVNCLLCWVILILSFWVQNNAYTHYILAMQSFCCFYLLHSVFSKDQPNPPKVNGKIMRKVVKNLEYTCTDFSECTDSGSSSKSGYLNSPDVPQQSFTTASTVTLNKCMSHDHDLNKSLNNLSLGKPEKPPTLINLNVARPRPVLSPPKLQNINSWVQGGFPGRCTNMSRSSSESSGFGSQHDGVFKPQFIAPEVYSPAPSYLFAPLEFRSNAFYPNLQGNGMFIVQGSRIGSPFHEPYLRREVYENWSDRINSQATQSFSDLRLHSD